MGKLEEENKRRTRNTDLQRAILRTVAIAGILSVGLLAPNVIGALHKLGLLPSLRENEIVKSAASRLRRKGLLKFSEGRYELTQAGEKILRRWEMTDYKLKKPKKWDRKWRVIIFDIPEKKRRVREAIRPILIESGFVRLQDSVWVYPYDCEDVIGLLKMDFGMGKDLLYLIVDQIEKDRHLREEFNLI
jgi:DNA-binding transcriptional regulator PaaX